ncbi:hypothetical protein A3A46_01330 [Candidatus Roizmanbacteria bacterium RIFCSPLOWO2_01_FULL_37_13]|uniref:Uncharacterized protein n=1 Tax=Candidatus Roizmanbacteria bacterium RIFCSPHIGHO2_02_FULL_38_11 TaxID=1802039 RepID=A0A1F7H0I0_9BACT|nr:MAG: hypothetical protein A3C25_01630 [Candidatus Roizmanbacteria bacterium RIFCSPHIGHO2_02_FULL_38_11]OGK32878.1 MAG: hypothetical protein A3F58_01170 [Candidatus Roizmanbacteria bacterium RIFCSPHIGHO2_12_FULL_37_9b]OGK42511.1 MAG: hypothetical protein A3A46_01330 [Candidatus Roizmanbacteria bacterium RIFCSPLOWO2_01_FULL_37_13]
MGNNIEELRKELKKGAGRSVDTISSQLRATTDILFKAAEQSSPLLDRDYWLKQGFTLKGWGGPIELMVGPRVINEQRFAQAVENTVFIDGLLNLAAAFIFSDPIKRQEMLATLPPFERKIVEVYFGPDYNPQRTLGVLESQPYYGRLDQLITTPEVPKSQSQFDYEENNINVGLAPIEMNRNGPEGIWFTHVAQDIYEKLYGIEPPITALNFIIRLLRKTAKRSGNANPLIGLVAPTDSVVSIVELQYIADALNSMGLGFRSLYGETDELEVSGTDVFLRRERLSGIWRNWGVQIQGEPDKSLAIYRTGIAVLNPPYSFVGGLKALFAVISTDPEFRAKLPKETLNYIDKLIPTTRLLTKAEDFDQIPRGNYIYKPAFASHGDGVTSDPEAAFSAVRDQGTPFVAQAKIPPEDPSIGTLILDEGAQLTNLPMLADFNNYVGHIPGQTKVAQLVVTRFKATHPINVAKGGGLGSGYPI